MVISKSTSQQMAASSWIRRMFEEGIELKNRYGIKQIFDLSLGNPILEPPEKFRQELINIAESDVKGLHKYMPNAGFYETRAAVSNTLSKETGMNFSHENIIMTTGAAGAINIFLRTILEVGDEVIVFAPYFPEYAFYIAHQQGNMKVAECYSNMYPDPESLKNAISRKTKAVILNSPNNPTGIVYPDSVIKNVARVVQDAEVEFGTHIYIISDDAYKNLTYTKKLNSSIFKYHIRCVAAGSYSKDLGLAGERIGYLAISPLDAYKTQIADGAVFALRTLGFVNAPAIAQMAVAKLQGACVDTQIYKRKRDMLFNGLVELGYTCPYPEGAFYIFPESLISDDVEFVRTLQSYRVLTVPGSGFGKPGYFRASYCVEDWVIEGALKVFAKLAKNMRV